MDRIKDLFSLTGLLLPSKLVFLPVKKVILPVYHIVSDNYLLHIHNLYKSKTTKEFSRDLDFLLKHFDPIDLKQLIEITHENKQVTKNYFHLSFDDGLRECYEVILPVLKEKEDLPINLQKAIFLTINIFKSFVFFPEGVHQA